MKLRHRAIIRNANKSIHYQNVNSESSSLDGDFKQLDRRFECIFTIVRSKTCEARRNGIYFCLRRVPESSSSLALHHSLNKSETHRFRVSTREGANECCNIFSVLTGSLRAINSADEHLGSTETSSFLRNSTNGLSS